MKKIIILFSILAASIHAYGQDIDLIIQSGASDAETLLENYFEPAFLGLAYGLTNSWTNTAKPHNPLGFDITLSASVAFVPKKSEFFTFKTSDYENITLADPSKNQLPTLFGPNIDADSLPELVFFKGSENELRLSAPSGLGMREAIEYNVVPAPMLQAGIGLLKETDLKVRLVPRYTYREDSMEVTVGMLGFGIMHDIKQYIEALAFSPFELSLLAGFSRIFMEFTPDISLPDNTLLLNVKGATLQVLISKEFIKVFTLYGSVGVNGAYTRVKLNGTYKIERTKSVLEDPLDFRFANYSPRFTAGVRLKLGGFTLHTDYTFQKYNTVSAGLGVSIR